ncbi:MAG: uridine kinase [Pseudobdellovibrio sp.]
MTDFSKQNNPPFVKPFFLGVAGGSGSGKTYFARNLQQQLGIEKCEIIYQDNFYIDQSKRFDFDGGSVNFDHPSSIDFSLLATHIHVLKAGFSTEIPVYDFVTHSRKAETICIRPKAIVIVDGILISHAEEVRFLFDELIFFDTPEDLRFQRRLERDVKERGRDPAGVHNQFYKQVKPMHDEFVEPSKKYANTVIVSLEQFDHVLQLLCTKFNTP